MGLSKYKLEPVLPPPASTEEVDIGELRRLLAFVTGSGGRVFLSDTTKYLLCNQADINRFVAADLTDKVKYEDERMDCDDFALRLAGQFSVPGWSALALGLMWTNIHALNCFITEDRRLWYLEPQTDKILDKLEPWQGSTIRFIQM